MMEKNIEIQNILEKHFEKLTKNKKYKHIVMHAQSLDESFEFKKVWGIIDSNQEAITLDTPFNIASVTKLYIATIIMMLHEKDQLSLEDKISKYLPEKLLIGMHPQHENEITIEHLLSHTSGIPDYLEVKDEHKKTLFDVIVEEGDHHWDRIEFFDRIKKYGKPNFIPQDLTKEKKKAKYSDTNFQLLMEIIERITKKSIDDVFEVMIYKPLGLKNTFHGGTKKSVQYQKASIWAGQSEMNINDALASFKDIYSTSHELIIFFKSLIQGKLFTNPITFNKMITKWNTLGFQLIPTSPGWPIQYGLGFIRFKYPSFLPPFKNIPEFYGHTGVTGSWVFYCPKYDIIIAGDVGQLSASPLPYQLMSKLLIDFKKVY